VHTDSSLLQYGVASAGQRNTQTLKTEKEILAKRKYIALNIYQATRHITPEDFKLHIRNNFGHIFYILVCNNNTMYINLIQQQQ